MRRYYQNKAMRASKAIELDADTKYAVVLLKLAPGVAQPDDYPALGAAIRAVQGIAGIELLVDGETTDVAEDERLLLVTDVHLRRETVEPVEPE